ncbi:MAG: GYD domain-containing protein [Candidatus Limnocylindrales bacterium]
MAAFVVLGNWTAEGAKAYADAPAREKANREAIAGMGGRLIGTWWTLGKYDFVSIIEVDSDESMAVGGLIGGARGFIRTMTMRAFSEDEMAALVAQAVAASAAG